ncbi:MAG TPA: HAD family phosphatase [Candidatus Saccharimonadales bacterium]|jgi:putative hydrolase of the HAD superfamily|nr:HAD family phosphatase [Candidatus Saccharimonadales bacterium]
MTKVYDTIFFDWGGVVADDPGDEFLGKLLKQLGASEAEIQEIFRTYMKRFMRGHISEVEYWAELKANYGYSIPDTISQEFMKWTGLEANADILELVESAKVQGLQTAIFSNVIEPTYNVLSRAGYYERFDQIIASCKVGYAKPEVEIYTLALDALGTVGPRSIFIDDKESNLIPARKLGFTTILAQNPEQIISDLNNLIL